MRKLFLIILLLTVVLIPFSSVFAAKVIVKGDPPITLKAVDCHIRLMEFILKTRLTLGQKETFVKAIRVECADMEKEDRENFLQACELLESMTDMDEDQREIVRKVLEKDFQESAASLPDDPAAQLYLRLYQKSEKPAFATKETLVSQQSFEAFLEYLAMIASPSQPHKYSAGAKKGILGLLKKNYSKLSEQEQMALEDFQFTWYMIRAGWAVADEKMKSSWRNYFAKLNLQPGAVINLSQLKKVLSTKVYADMLDISTLNGFQPMDWVAEEKVRVW